LKGLINQQPEDLTELDKLYPDSASFIANMKQCSAYSFKRGISQLSEAIVRDLNASDVVDLRINAPVNHLEFPADGGVTVSLADGTVHSFDHVISSLPANRLSSLLPNPLSSILSSIEFVDVAVVNLAYRGKSVLPINGFGYLVPASQPSSILGVVFDSSVLPEQDADNEDGNITRVTAMMGGHRFRELFGKSDLVDKSKLLEIAVNSIREHLGLKAEPFASLVTIQRECIPQYTIGHWKRLMALHDGLDSTLTLSGRISVVGSSFLGVSVNDCVRSARDVAEAVFKGESVTGLERAYSFIK
jgi:oxygen-dependent protoporphyrinogen oxidase